MNKKIVISFILGILFCAFINVIAASFINGNEVQFTPKNDNWKVNNVEDAINEIYDKSIVESIDGTFTYSYFRGTKKSTNTHSINLDKGKYYIFVTVDYAFIDTNVHNNYQTNTESNLSSSTFNCELKHGISDETNGNEKYTSYYIGYISFHHVYLCTGEEDGVVTYTSPLGGGNFPIYPFGIYMTAMKIR